MPSSSEVMSPHIGMTLLNSFGRSFRIESNSYRKFQIYINICIHICIYAVNGPILYNFEYIQLILFKNTTYPSMCIVNQSIYLHNFDRYEKINSIGPQQTGEFPDETGHRERNDFSQRHK